MNLKESDYPAPTRRPNNEQYMLKSWDEEKELLATPGFADYGMKVYDWLEFDMPKGSEFSLLPYTGKQLEWTVKICCIFIYSGYHWIEYEFDQNFTKVTRHNIPPEELEELVEKEKIKMREIAARNAIKQAV